MTRFLALITIAMAAVHGVYGSAYGTGYPAPAPYKAPAYTAPAYPAKPYAAPAYPAKPYAAPAYPAKPYAAPAYPAKSYAAPAYPAKSYAAPAYPAPAAYQSQEINAAIQNSQRDVKVIDVPSSYAMPDAMTIHVPASQQPLTFLLRSRSSQLNLQSTHEPSPGSYQETSSEDEPHILVHTVTRPVLQEIREIIAPFRKISQEIKPVQENAETLVARGPAGGAQGMAGGAAAGGARGGASGMSAAAGTGGAASAMGGRNSRMGAGGAAGGQYPAPARALKKGY